MIDSGRAFLSFSGGEYEKMEVCSDADCDNQSASSTSTLIGFGRYHNDPMEEGKAGNWPENQLVDSGHYHNDPMEGAHDFQAVSWVYNQHIQPELHMGTW